MWLADPSTRLWTMRRISGSRCARFTTFAGSITWVSWAWSSLCRAFSHPWDIEQSPLQFSLNIVFLFALNSCELESGLLENAVLNYSRTASPFDCIITKKSRRENASLEKETVQAFGAAGRTWTRWRSLLLRSNQRGLQRLWFVLPTYNLMQFPCLVLFRYWQR